MALDMNLEHRPVLCVVAGPNGSGKTSTTERLLANEWAADSVYINPDNIAQEQFGDWNSQEAVLCAAKEATRLRYQCLDERKNFVFETVFSSQEKLDFLKKAKEAGFFIRFFYVCTDNPEINILRIAQRYINGGHEVPMSKIISRYYKSLTLAAEAILLSIGHMFTTIRVITNCRGCCIALSKGKYVSGMLLTLPYGRYR